MDIEPKIYTSNPNNFGEDYEGFVCDVVNGADKASTGTRSHFTHLYGDWFPPFAAAHDLHWQKAYYREVLLWWKTSLRDLPAEEHDEQFGLHTPILRHKFRVIWLVADSGEIDEAIAWINQLLTRFRRGNPLDREQACEARHQLLVGTFHWLARNVGKLRVCKNPNCQGMTYFVQYNHRKYCSPLCYAEADVLKRKERAKASPKKYKRSPEARENMHQSALRRWEKERNKRGLKRGEHGSGQASKNGRHG